MAETVGRDKRLEIPGRVNFAKGQGGLPMIQVKTDSSMAEIYLHGAQVTHFQKQGDAPLLWMSQESRFHEQSPIRGGIPIILPWFGAREGMVAHGFARVTSWELQETGVTANGGVRLHLRLPERADVAGFAPFTADYMVMITDRLELELVVANAAPDRELVYEDCLHSYFTVGDISAVSVVGLKGAKYLDKVAGPGERTEVNDAITIASEVDRVYLDTTAAVEIHDAELRRKIRVEKEGSASTVVWNPWIAKSKAMPDFGDEEYHGMVCVESGNVGKNKVTLPPGKKATLKVKLFSSTL